MGLLWDSVVCFLHEGSGNLDFGVFCWLMSKEIKNRQFYDLVDEDSPPSICAFYFLRFWINFFVTQRTTIYSYGFLSIHFLCGSHILKMISLTFVLLSVLFQFSSIWVVFYSILLWMSWSIVVNCLPLMVFLVDNEVEEP